MAVSKRKSIETEYVQGTTGSSAKKEKLNEEKVSVMLGNDCQRYMTPKGELFVAGKRYLMSTNKRKELFSYADENGIRFFYDTEVIEMQIEAAKRKGRRYTEAEDGEAGEMDTGRNKGVVTLHDDEGESGRHERRFGFDLRMPSGFEIHHQRRRCADPLFPTGFVGH